jgi:predicted phage tail protein
MTDRSPKAGRSASKPDDAPAGSDPAAGGTSRLDWQRLVAGLVLIGASLFLLVAQGTAPEGSDTSLLSGPMGLALDIGGIVAGVWVIWTAWRR